jgi:hypothetical protein
MLRRLDRKKKALSQQGPQTTKTTFLAMVTIMNLLSDST